VQAEHQRQRKAQVADLCGRMIDVERRLRLIRGSLTLAEEEAAGLARELAILRATLEQDATAAYPALERRVPHHPALDPPADGIGPP
jgi:hypothetical protein